MIRFHKFKFVLVAFLVCSSLEVKGCTPSQPLELCKCGIEQFALLHNENLLPTVGAEMRIGPYPDEMSAEKVFEVLKPFDESTYANQAEWLVAKEFEYRKAGDLRGIISLYLPSAKAYIERSDKNLEATRKYAKSVNKLHFLYRAEFGSVIHIAYEQLTASIVNPDWQADAVATDKGYLLAAPPKNNAAVSVASLFPYWVEPAKRKFGSTAGVIRIPLLTGLDEWEGAKPSSKLPPSNPAYLLVRTSPVTTVGDLLDRISVAFRTGSDDDVAKLFDADSQPIFRAFTQDSDGATYMRNTRQFFKVNENALISFVISGVPITYVAIRPAVDEPGKDNQLFRAVRSRNGFLLSMQNTDESTAADDILRGHPDLVAEIAKMALK